MYQYSTSTSFALFYCRALQWYKVNISEYYASELKRMTDFSPTCALCLSCVGIREHYAIMLMGNFICI